MSEGNDERRRKKLREWAKERRAKNLEYNSALSEEIRQLREENDEIRGAMNSLFNELMIMANIDYSNAINLSSPNMTTTPAAKGATFASADQQLDQSLDGLELLQHEDLSGKTTFGVQVPPGLTHMNPMMTMNTPSTISGGQSIHPLSINATTPSTSDQSQQSQILPLPDGIQYHGRQYNTKASAGHFLHPHNSRAIDQQTPLDDGLTNLSSENPSSQTEISISSYMKKTRD